MNRRKTYLIVGLYLLTVATASQADESPLVPAELEKNGGSDLTIDSWNPKPLEKKSLLGSEPAEKSVQSPSSSSAPASTKEQKAVTPASSSSSAPPTPSTPLTDQTHPPRTRIPMNEMTGTLSSIDSEAQTIRLSIEGGFNPELPYTKDTAVWIEGRKAALSALQYGDRILVRYMGRDLTLKEIEKK